MIEDFLLNTGRVYIYGEIEASLRTIQELTYLGDCGYTLIHIYVDSVGGDPDRACAIIDKICELKEMGVIVNLVVQGVAYSCAADIVVFGSEALGYPSCKLMLHPAKFQLEYEEINKHAQSIVFEGKMQEVMLQKIAKTCGYRGKSVKVFAEKIKNDLWVDLKEAIKLGLLDRVYTKEDELKLIEHNKELSIKYNS